MRNRHILIFLMVTAVVMLVACNDKNAGAVAQENLTAFAQAGETSMPEDSIPHTEELCLTAYNMYANYDGETVHIKSLIGYETHMNAQFPDIGKQVLVEEGISISYEVGPITHGPEGCEEEISTIFNDDGDEITYQYVYQEGVGGYQCLYKPLGNPEDEWYLCITINTKDGVEKDEPISEAFYDLTKDCYYVFQ